MTHAGSLGFSLNSVGFRLARYRLANGSLETPASTPSEMTRVQVPLPACSAVLSRMSSQALKIHNEPSFCLLTYVLHIRPWIMGYIRPHPEFSFINLLRLRPMAQTVSLKEALPVQQVNIGEVHKGVQWEDIWVRKKVCIGGYNYYWTKKGKGGFKISSGFL